MQPADADHLRLDPQVSAGAALRAKRRLTQLENLLLARSQRLAVPVGQQPPRGRSIVERIDVGEPSLLVEGDRSILLGERSDPSLLQDGRGEIPARLAVWVQEILGNGRGEIHAGKPRLAASVVCPGGQGDTSIYGNLAFMSVEGYGRLDCGSEPSPNAGRCSMSWSKTARSTPPTPRPCSIRRRLPGATGLSPAEASIVLAPAAMDGRRQRAPATSAVSAVGNTRRHVSACTQPSHGSNRASSRFSQALYCGRMSSARTITGVT